jgi:deoxyhypusine synthase
MVKEKMFDVIITTCGMLDHDLARTRENYYHGEFEMDDAKLRDEGVNRLGNILVPNESYGIVLEKMMQPILQELWDEGKRELSTRELAWEFGRRAGTEDSILYWAAKNEIPIYVPGITDGAFGSQLWQFSQEHKDFRIDLLKDEKELADIVFTAKKTGALMVGGGISKHHTIWWNQFRDGLDYAVYITTAVEHDGSLSGARIREAVSWGKVQKDAKFITVEGDATILLPIMMNALMDSI